MKDSKKYVKNTQKMFRTLRQNYPKVKRKEFDDPIEAIVYAVLCEHANDSTANIMLKKISAHFVDLNDLRVSRKEEIQDVLGDVNGDLSEVASMLGKSLNAIFTRYNSLSLDTLKEVGKKHAMAELEKLEGLSRFVIDYCFLVALSGHAIPLTEQMVEYLKTNQIVHPNSSNDDISGFLARQISAAHGYEFYALLREDSGKSTGKAKKATVKKRQKKVTKTKAVKNTVDKKTTKKKTSVKKKSVKKKTVTKKVKKTTKKKS